MEELVNNSMSTAPCKRHSRPIPEKWSTREKLCLLSTVSSLGNENWSAVSRCMKTLCAESLTKHSEEWLSNSNCAMEYDRILSDPQHALECTSSNSISNFILKPNSLIELRIIELKDEIRKAQEEFAKMCERINFIESTDLDYDQLSKIWNEIKAQKETSVSLEELGTVMYPSTNNREQTKAEIPLATEELIDEQVIEEKASVHPVVNTSSTPSTLLSNLLKSPSTTIANVNLTANNTSILTSSPTITTLLTGGTIPNTSQPAIIPSRDNVVQLLTRPLSGPPPESSSPTANIPSPSQSAPTLSMLLEKTRPAGGGYQQKAVDKDTKIVTTTPKKKSSELKKDATPVSTSATVVEVPLESTNNDDAALDAPDPVEEQQLLELFKNIGNIEELDIDMGDVLDEGDVEFLKDEQGLESPIPTGDNENVGDAELSVTNHEDNNDNVVSTCETEEVKTDEINEKQMKSPMDKDDQSDKDAKNTKPIVKESAESHHSSDDSIDDVPLATVAIRGNVKEQISVDKDTDVEVKKEPATEESGTKIDDAKIKHELKGEMVVKVVKLEPKVELGENKLVAGDVCKVKPEEDHQPIKEDPKSLETNTTTATESTEAIKSESPVNKQSKPTDSIKNVLKKILVKESEKRKEASDEIKTAEGIKKDEITVAKEKQGKSSNAAKVTTLPSEQQEVPRAQAVVKVVKSGEEKKRKLAPVMDLETTHEGKVSPVVKDQAEESLQTNISVVETDEDTSSTIHSSSTIHKEKTGASKTQRKTNSASGDQRRALGKSETSASEMETTNRIFTQSPLDQQVSNTNSNTILGARMSSARKAKASVSGDSESATEGGITHSTASAGAFDEESQMSTDYINQQKLRQRFSSTPIIESIPNSPASSERDDREVKVPKKVLLSIYSTLHGNKNAQIVQAVLSGAMDSNHCCMKADEICLRPISFQAIKKSIDTGAIRTIVELQRDVFLMCQNAIMMTKTTSKYYKNLLAFYRECQMIREFAAITPPTSGSVDRPAATQKSTDATHNLNTSSKGRSGSRKSTRIL